MTMIGTESGPDLTERQLEIAQRFAVRTPIKEIAAEFGIAPSTVNDHLASAKRKLGVRSNKELAQCVLERFQWVDDITATPEFGGCINDRVAVTPAFADQSHQDGPPPLMLNDSLSLRIGDAWFEHAEPKVVPEVLDGPAAGWPRVMEIVKIVTLILAALVLALAALQSVEGVVGETQTASQ